MPSYLSDPKQSFVPTNLYTPNFDAIGGMLRIKQAEYNQGFDQVKSTYNSILNAPLTKEVNVVDRDNYLKAAQNSLKDLSSVDLSMNQNVAQASQVFQPFFQDKDIVNDMMWTKQNNKEIQRGMDLRDSKDEKLRSQYFGQSIAVLQDQAVKVRGAAKGDTSVYENKKYVPYKDYNEYLGKQAKEQGLGIEYVTGSNSPILYEMKNGQKSIKDFKLWAQTQLATPEFQDIFHVMGEYDNNYQVKQYQKQIDPATNQPYTEKGAQERVAHDYVNNQKEFYDKLTTESTSNIGKLQQQQKDLLTKYPNGFPTEKNSDGSPKLSADAQLYANYEAQIMQHQDNLSTAKEQTELWAPHGKNYEQTIDNIKNFGATFFAQQYGTRAAEQWAQTYVGVHSGEKAKDNSAYTDRVKAEIEMIKINQSAYQFGVKTAAGYWQKGGKGTGAGSGQTMRADGSYPVQGEADYNSDGITDQEQGYGDAVTGKMSAAERKLLLGQSQYSGQRTGFSITNVQKISDLGAYYSGMMQANYDMSVTQRAGAIGKLLPGLAIKFKDGTTLSQSDAIGFSNIIKDGFTTGKASFNDPTFTKVVNYFKEQGYNIDPKSPTSIVNAIRQETTKRYASFTAGSAPLPPGFAEGTSELLSSDDQYNKWYQQHDTYTKQMNDLIKSKSSYANLGVKEADGKVRLMTAVDLQKDFGTLKGTISVPMPNNALTPFMGMMGGVRTDVNIPVKDLAEKYMSGEAKVDIDNSVMRKNKDGGTGKWVNITLGDQTYHLDEASSKHFNDVIKKYGKPAEFAKSIKDLGTHAAEMAGSIFKDGRMGQDISYAMGDPKNESFAFKLNNDMANPSNYSDTNIDDPTIRQFVSKLPSSPEFIQNVHVLNVTDKGVPGIRYDFKPEMFTKKGDILNYQAMGLSKEAADKIMKNGLTLYVSPNAQGDAINRIIRPKDNFVYQNVIEGQILKSDVSQESANFRYTLTPSNYKGSGKAEYVTLHVESKRVNDKGVWDAEFSPWSSQSMPNGEIRIPLTGDNGQSIDDVKTRVDQLFASHLTLNNEKIKAHIASMNQNIQNGTTNVMTPDQIREYVKNNR